VTLKDLLASVVTALQTAGIDAFLAEHLNVDANGNLLAPTTAEHVIVHLIGDPATGDFDREVYSTTRIQVDAWAGTVSAAHDLLATAESTLADWERVTTRSLGRDAASVGISMDLTRSR
jgi:hypothetical protein